MNRRVLTIHGQRAWWHNSEDTAYAGNSIVRGYAGLNAAIHRLINKNPQIIVQSVSHSSVTVPEANGYMALHMFATVVYSGEITTLAGLTLEERERDLSDEGVGYDTVITLSSL